MIFSKKDILLTARRWRTAESFLVKFLIQRILSEGNLPSDLAFVKERRVMVNLDLGVSEVGFVVVALHIPGGSEDCRGGGPSWASSLSAMEHNVHFEHYG